MSMHPDLKWLAENVSEWKPEPFTCDDPCDALIRIRGCGKVERYCGPNSISARDPLNTLFTYDQWRQARQELGLDNTETPEEKEAWEAMEEKQASSRSDGSTASYYQLPEGCTELQHLISHRNMNFFVGFIFCLCYDYSKSGHSDIRIAKEIEKYALAEVERIEGLQDMQRRKEPF